MPFSAHSSLSATYNKIFFERFFAVPLLASYYIYRYRDIGENMGNGSDVAIKRKSSLATTPITILYQFVK